MILGLTGDVGAGKSTLCAIWREMGADVFDADKVAKNLWKLKSIQNKAEKRWGEGFFLSPEKEVLKKIADKIFNSDEEYEFASNLLHKATISKLKKLVNKSTSKWIVVEIPLLFECGAPSWIDATVYVTASIDKRAKRNVSRGWNEEELLRREDKLLPREEKVTLSDWVLENNGNIDEWIVKGKKMGEKFISLSAEC